MPSEPGMENNNVPETKSFEAQTPPPLTADNIAYMNAMKQWEENQKANTPPEIPQDNQTVNIVAAMEGTNQFTHDPERLGNIAPDREDGMAEAAVEAKQKAEIEQLAAEAATISPDFENGVKTELQETAKETLKMKIESKVYDFLTSLERKIGQSIVMGQIKQGFAYDKWSAREWIGAKWNGMGKAEQRKRGYEDLRNLEIGKRNLKAGIEEVRFTPGGDVIPPEIYGGPVVAEGPSADYRINLGKRGAESIMVSPYSSRIGISAKMAQSAVEANPIINKLEEWRGNLQGRQKSVEEATQLVRAYGTVTAGV